MKKKLIALSGAVLLAGCTPAAKEELHVSSGSSVINFTLGTGYNDVVTYTPIHDDSEYGIERLDIFEFDKNNSDEKYYLSKIYKNHHTESAVTPDNPAKRTVSRIKVPKGSVGTKRYLFVANMTAPGNEESLTSNKMAEDLTLLQVKNGNVNGVEFNEVKQKLTRTLTANGDLNLVSKFLMTGEKEIEITPSNEGTTINAAVMLTRSVARLDVAVSLVDNGESLKITKMEFENVPDRAYLLPSYKEATNKSSAFMAPLNFKSLKYKTYTSDDLAIHYDAQPTNYYQYRYKQLYYFYELAKEQFNNKVPTVIISAEYKKDNTSEPVKMRYVIPFDRDIKRNHLYTIILGVKRVPGSDDGSHEPTPDPDEDRYEATATLHTLKWEEESSVASIPSLISLNFYRNFGIQFSPLTHTISLESGDKLTSISFVVKSMFYGDDNMSNVQVLTNDPTGKVKNPNNSWFHIKSSGSENNGHLDLEVDSNNETGERSGMVWLKTTNSNGYHYVLIVHQPKKNSR